MCKKILISKDVKRTEKIAEESKKMYPKRLGRMHYSEIIDAIKKDKKCGYKHFACKMVLDDNEEQTEFLLRHYEVLRQNIEFERQSKKLQHKLDVAEKVIQLLSKSNISNVMEEERQPLIDYIREQAEKEIKGE